MSIRWVWAFDKCRKPYLSLKLCFFVACNIFIRKYNCLVFFLWRCKCSATATVFSLKMLWSFLRRFLTEGKGTRIDVFKWKIIMTPRTTLLIFINRVDASVFNEMKRIYFRTNRHTLIEAVFVASKHEPVSTNVGSFCLILISDFFLEIDVILSFCCFNSRLFVSKSTPCHSFNSI